MINNKINGVERLRNKSLLTFCLIILISLNGCIFSSSDEETKDQPKVTVDGEYTITNDYNWDGYREGVKLRITSIEPTDAVLDSGEVEVEVLKKYGEKASTWYQGKIAEIDFFEQVSFSNLYDCVGDKDTIDKGDFITFWFKEDNSDYVPTLDGYTISLYWKDQKIFSKIIDFSELKFENTEKIELVLSLKILTNKTSYLASSTTIVPFTVVLNNMGNVTYTIDEPSLIYQSLKIEVTTPDNNKIYHVYSIEELPKPVILSPNAPIKVSFNIGGERWNDDELSHGEPGFYFSIKGKYSIKATFESGCAEKSQTEDCKIDSNTIIVNIND